MCIRDSAGRTHGGDSPIVPRPRHFGRTRGVGIDGRSSLSDDFLEGPAEAVAFAHSSEREFARLLDFYDVDWAYEPRAFSIDWDAAGVVTKQFRPDFYLPDDDLYIEITTMSQKLVTKKNGKIRRLHEPVSYTHLTLTTILRV